MTAFDVHAVTTVRQLIDAHEAAGEDNYELCDPLDDFADYYDMRGCFELADLYANAHLSLSRFCEFIRLKEAEEAFYSGKCDEWRYMCLR